VLLFPAWLLAAGVRILLDESRPFDVDSFAMEVHHFQHDPTSGLNLNGQERPPHHV
jgi:hypothetical protein